MLPFYLATTKTGAERATEEYMMVANDLDSHSVSQRPMRMAKKLNMFASFLTYRICNSVKWTNRPRCKYIGGSLRPQRP